LSAAAGLAHALPERAALHDGSRAWTASEVSAEVESLARRLHERNVRVLATLADNTPGWAIIDLAAASCGIVHVPLPLFFTGDQVDHALRAAGIDTVLCSAPAAARWPHAPREVVQVAGQPYAQIRLTSAAVSMLTGTRKVTFTSGTTGTPKGVPIPVRAVASFQIYLEYGLHVTEDDVFWNAADPGWAYGLYYAIIAPMAAGRRSLLLQAGFSPELTWRVMSEYGVTNLAAAPTVFRSLRSGGLPVPKDLALRAITSAGEPLNPEMVTWARDNLGVEIHDTYGQTELGMCGINGWHPDVKAPVR